jgi:hypothetical protein
MSDDPSFPCPCCGYVVFDEGPGSYEICPICFWEDDLSQLRFPSMRGGANRPSLQEAQIAFKTVGAIEERFIQNVRAPSEVDRRDPAWRPLDSHRDVIEVPQSGVDYGKTYPEDSRALYYWRRAAAAGT